MVQPDEYGTIEEMLPEYFEGTLTAKNKAIVEQWIAASEENEQAAWQFYSLYMAIDTASVMERVDTAQALKTVNRRLQRKAFYSKNRLVASTHGGNPFHTGSGVRFLFLHGKPGSFEKHGANDEFLDRTGGNLVGLAARQHASVPELGIHIALSFRIQR